MTRGAWPGSGPQGLSGCDVCTLCYRITQAEAGAVGVADLALKPESASKHACVWKWAKSTLTLTFIMWTLQCLSRGDP